MKKFWLGIFVGMAAAALIAALSLSVVPAYGDRIAVLRIKGTITSSPSLFYQSISPESLFPLLEQVEKDPGVKGVLLEINSPGGSPVASREISMAIRDLEKPTVCWLGDVAASGAYWIASACDRIVADPLSMTGSIGATASYIQFAGTMEEYGVTYERLVSGEEKDTGSPFRNMTESERESWQRIVDDTFGYFLEDIVRNRDLDDESVETISGGGLFLGKDAVGLGLVDDLGTWYDAREMIINDSGAVAPRFIELQDRGISMLDLLSGFL